MEQDQKRRQNTLRSIGGLIRRCYRDVSALRATPSGSLILPGMGHKYDEVRDELTNATYGSRFKIIIARTSYHRPRLDHHAIMIVLRTLRLVFRAHRSPRLRPYRDVLVQSRAFALALGQQQPHHWVIIGDLSTYLIALAAACKEAGHVVVYWQYSFLDFKHMPVPADIAVILNDTGLQLAVPDGHHQPQSVFWRPRSAIAKLRLEALERGSLAAMLNVHADIRALQQLEVFCKTLARPIEVRLHPNSKLGEEVWPEGLTRAPEDETLEAFSRRHVLIFGGNTQAQAKALSLGTPVVHCDGLDPLPFDHHGYVTAGILPGCTIGEVPDMEEVQSFFSSADYANGLLALMGPEPNRRCPGIISFVAGLEHQPLPAQDSKASKNLSERIL